MFKNPRRGRQARNFTTNAPKILDLKSSSEQIFSRKLPLGAPDAFRTCLCLWLVLVNIALDHQQQIADISRLRKFNTSLPRSHFCGEKRCVMRQKETIMKQGVLRIHRNNFEYTNFIMI